MAEPLSLEEFIQKSLSTLNAEDTSPQQVHEVFIGMQQYAPLRNILKDQKEITGDILLDVLTKEFPLAGKRAEALDQPMSPAEITARAEIFAKTQQQIPEATRQRFEQERKNYARKVARKWVERLRNDRLYNVSQEEEQIITRSIENLPPTTSATETRNAVVNQLQTLTQTNPNLSRGQTVIAQIAQTTELAEPTQIRQQIFNTILDHPDADQSIFLGLAAQGVDIQRAAQLADLGKVFSADINPAIDVTRPTVFFQAFAKSGLQKLVAPAADAFLTVLPQETREAVVESVLTKSWERIDQKFGGAVVGSKPFQDALAQGNSAFAARPPSTGGIAAGFGRIIGDVVNPILGRNIDQVMIEQYLELSKTTTITQQLTWRHFYAMSAHSHDPSIFSFAFEGGRWVLGFAGKRVVSAAAKGVAAKLSGTTIGAAIGSLIPIPGVGTAVGAIVGFIGGKLIEPLLRGAGSLLKNIFGGGFITRLFAGGTGRWQDDLPLVATIIVLLPIILIFLLPTFLNPQFIGHTAQSSALADIGGGIGPGGSTIDCSKTPDIPECKLTQCQGDCRWPLDTSTGACIIEGPFVGTHSGSHLSAVDFATLGGQARLSGAPVHTPYAGTVWNATFGYNDGCTTFNGCITDGNTYGNNVIIQTDKGARLLFAHLRNISVVNKGAPVAAGTVIGYVDHTGYSRDVHLHYEARTPGDINEYLPYPVPPCGSYQDCSAKLKALGHSACI